MSASDSFVPDDISSIMVYQQIESTNAYKEVNLDDSSLNAAYSKWIIFDCIEGSCKRAYGYVKTNEETPEIYSFSHTPTQAQLSSGDISEACASGDSSSKMIKADGTFCITHDDENPILGTMELGKTYIYTTTSSSVFYGTQSKEIIIKATKNTLTYSPNYATMGPNIFSGGKKIEKNEISNEIKDKLGLYTCPSGICEKIPGYIIRDNEIFSVTSTPVSNAYSPASTAKCTGKVGEIITHDGANFLCLTEELSVDITQEGNYVLGTLDSANVFTDDNKLIKIKDGFIVLDTIDGGKLFYGLFIFFYLHKNFVFYKKYFFKYFIFLS